MQNFDYQRRTFILFGRGRENEVGSLVKYEGGRRVLLHYGNDAKRKPDLLDRIKRALDRAGLEFFELGGVEMVPNTDLVYQGIDFCRQEQIDFILGIGRSAAIDSAKAISAGTLYNGDFWDFFSGLREPVRALPLGAIVTSSDAGSECSGTCILSAQIDGRARKVSKSSPTFLPRFAILNPELSLNMSNEVTAIGAMDMIAHIIECYFTNTPNVQVTDELCEGILRTIVNILPRVLADPGDYDARANLMLAGSLAQNGMCGLGREADWSTHILELELSSRYHTNHGKGLAVLLPAWMTYCLHFNVMRMAQFANRVFGIAMNFDDPAATAHRGIDEFRSFLSRCGLPQNFAEMGLSMVDIVELVDNLKSRYNGTIGNYVKLDANACESIYTIAYTYRHHRPVLGFTDIPDSNSLIPPTSNPLNFN